MSNPYDMKARAIAMQLAQSLGTPSVLVYRLWHPQALAERVGLITR